MTRFLFVVPPLAGHVNPTISVGRELTGRGHEVAWAGPPGETDGLLPDDVRFFPAGRGEIADAAERLRQRFRGLRYAAALKFLWEEVLIPLAHAMADDVDRLVDSWSPDVLVVDQQALAGAAVARKRAVTWATTATTTAELVEPLATFPLAARWVEEQLAELEDAVGVPEDRRAARVAGAGTGGAGDLRFSEHLVLVFSSHELVGEHLDFPPHYAFVGPSISDRPETQPFPWDWLDPALPHVVVTLGTLNLRAGERFLTAAVEALAGQPLQAVLVASPDVLDGAASAPNLLVQEQVPMLRLLPRLDAVVCHGGHNTTSETLAHGLPLVIAPVVDDQPIVADQVVRAGAGIRLRFSRARPVDIRDALRQVLDEPSFREAARAVQRSFQRAGGAPAAARLLEQLAAVHRPPAVTAVPSAHPERHDETARSTP